MKESELFGQVKRYQLPIGQRQDTYSAVLKADLKPWQRGDRVAVKGPFRDKDSASVSIKVDALKRCAPVQLLEKVVVQLVPDIFEDTSQRMNRQAGLPGWYLVCEDLTKQYELPMCMHSPTANFPDGLLVVDWELLAKQGYQNQIPFAKDYESSIYAKDPEAARQLVMHVLLDWVFGVGGDLALRNFIWPKAGTIYNIDVDNIGRFEWHLGNVQICKANHRMGKHFQRFLQEFDLAELRECLERVDWSQQPPEAKRRAALDKQELLALLVVVPRKKRDQSPKRN